MMTHYETHCTFIVVCCMSVCQAVVMCVFFQYSVLHADSMMHLCKYAFCFVYLQNAVADTFSCSWKHFMSKTSSPLGNNAAVPYIRVNETHRASTLKGYHTFLNIFNSFCNSRMFQIPVTTRHLKSSQKLLLKLLQLNP